MRRVLILVGALVLSVAASRAAEPAKDEKVEITGSHIKQTVHRVGYSADTVAPIYVFDRQFIERTGATTLAGVLRYIPQAKVRGF